MNERDQKLTYVDTHCHLSNDRFNPDRLDVIARAARSGVTRVIDVAFSPRMWAMTRSLAAREPGRIAFTIGLHPTNVDVWTDAVGDQIRLELQRGGACAVGETGLDYYWDASHRDSQMASFATHLDLALEFGLPVVIHMRGGVEMDVRSVIEARRAPHCVFHSFEGSRNMLGWILENGWTVGVGGLMSRRSAKELRAMLTDFPLENVVLETDSPYLSPTGWPDKRNSPETIPIIAEHLARLRGVDIAEIASITTESAQRIFGLDSIEIASARRGAIAAGNSQA
jgi:TatD DNase family protein